MIYFFLLKHSTKCHHVERNTMCLFLLLIVFGVKQNAVTLYAGNISHKTHLTTCVCGCLMASPQSVLICCLTTGGNQSRSCVPGLCWKCKGVVDQSPWRGERNNRVSHIYVLRLILWLSAQCTIHTYRGVTWRANFWKSPADYWRKHCIAVHKLWLFNK